MRDDRYPDSPGPADGGQPQTGQPARVSQAEEPRFSRRRVLKLGVAGITGVIAAGIAGAELIDHGVLPGKVALEHVLGDCSVPAPPLGRRAPEHTVTGSFLSRARNHRVGYKLAYPPGHGPGSELPLVLALHGYGSDHNMNIGNLSLQESLAATFHGKPLPPMAMIAADGGGGYWNAHPGDDPMKMLIDEVIPMCQRLGLGRNDPIGTFGLSMGGYGAILVAEQNPRLISAVAAVSPAIWTSYSQARAVNAGAYASAADFAADDAVTHAAALAGIPTRVASGIDDPFHPGAVALKRASPPSVEFYFGPGCHGGSFWNAQQHPALQFLGRHLAGGVSS